MEGKSLPRFRASMRHVEEKLRFYIQGNYVLQSAALNSFFADTYGITGLAPNCPEWHQTVKYWSALWKETLIWLSPCWGEGQLQRPTVWIRSSTAYVYIYIITQRDLTFGMKSLLTKMCVGVWNETYMCYFLCIYSCLYLLWVYT